MKILVQTSGGGVVLLAVAALLAGRHGAPVGAALVAVLIALAAAVTLIAVAGAGWLAYRARRADVVQPVAPRLVAPPARQELPGVEPHAIASPRELHLHLHELTPEQIAALLRAIPPGTGIAD
jgi:hypothetical protein